MIALSGGGDSVALLDLVSIFSRSHNITLHAAKVMHGIRLDEEENSEAELCMELCRQRGIPFKILSSESDTVADIQSRYGCGPEQAARKFRHQLLGMYKKEISADFILLGHTADDNLETIFMRLLSGSGPEGLSGISQVREDVLKPLLRIKRSELRE
ncbi:MAG: tRNA lysidine(34) synthetase TilS, partial [Spirochaetaceae bacterium]|nr:tRNA lysidine(34) synthetase TilS [Spirochaetaceae bacterium]